MERVKAGWRRYRALPGRWQAGIPVAVVVLLGVIGSAGGEHKPATVVASAAATTDPATSAPPAEPSTTAPTTTSTAAAVDAGLPAGEDATVGRVVDGDTLEMSDGTTVRLIGVDTPETKDPSRPVGCYGPEASAYTEERFPPGTRVRLVYDVERTDRYGRDLVYLYRAEDGMFLNERLVLDGFAQVATFPPNVAHVEDFTAGQTAAREAGRGLWGPVCAAPATTVAPVVTSAPAPAPAVRAPSVGGAFENCTAAREAGAAPVRRGQPGYGPNLDRDGDGIGCE